MARNYGSMIICMLTNLPHEEYLLVAIFFRSILKAISLKEIPYENANTLQDKEVEVERQRCFLIFQHMEPLHGPLDSCMCMLNSLLDTMVLQQNNLQTVFTISVVSAYLHINIHVSLSLAYNYRNPYWSY